MLEYVIGCSSEVRLKMLHLILIFFTFTAHIQSNVCENQLSKEEYMEYDRQVSSWYDHSAEELDENKVRHEDYLHQTVKSIHHTIAVKLNNYHYHDVDDIVKSRGPNVNDHLCDIQLDTLVSLAKSIEADTNGTYIAESAPLSAIEFFDSYGHVPRAVLTGNYRWHGSYSSCIKGLIPAKTAMESYSKSKKAHQIDSGLEKVDETFTIKGSYCVAHLRAKNWSTTSYYDKIVSIEVGICLPETCDTTAYTRHPETIDYLARFNLLKPFNSDRYNITELYCLPDERSELRQLTFGAWSLIIFLIIWFCILLYCEYGYCRRKDIIQHQQTSRLTEDIRGYQQKSIVNIVRYDHDNGGDSGEDQKLYDNNSRNSIDKNDNTMILPLDQKATFVDDNISSKVSTILNHDIINGGGNSLEAKQQLQLPHSAQNSVNPSPVNSDLEENDGDFRGIRPLVRVGRLKKTTTKSAYNYDLNIDSIDWLSAFSVTSNLKFLFGSRKNERRMRNFIDRRNSTNSETAMKIKKKVSIKSLDGIKVIGTIWIVMAHTLMFGFGLVTNLRHSKDNMLDFTIIAMINGLQVVGIFYIITGTLVSYLAFSKGAKHVVRIKVWILALIQRYLRLIPLYFLIYWFAKHLSQFTSYGPMWSDYRTDSDHYRTHCSREPWSNMFLMVASSVKIPNHCIPQAWYLSDDFQTLLVLPFYVYLLARDYKTGYYSIIGTIIYAFYSIIQRSNDASIDFRQIVEWKPHVFSLLMDRFHQTYTHFSIRLSTYLVGIMTGHLLYLYENDKITRWPYWLEKYGLTVALMNAILLFFGAPILSMPMINQYLPDPRKLDSATIATLIPFFKTSMELSLSVIILMLCTGHGNKMIRRTFNSQLAKVLSNLSYAVYLIHIEVLVKLPYEFFEVSYMPLFTFGAYAVATSYILGFILYVGFEMPINNIMRHIFKILDPTKT